MSPRSVIAEAPFLSRCRAGTRLDHHWIVFRWTGAAVDVAWFGVCPAFGACAAFVVCAPLGASAWSAAVVEMLPEQPHASAAAHQRGPALAASQLRCRPACSMSQRFCLRISSWIVMGYLSWSPGAGVGSLASLVRYLQTEICRQARTLPNTPHEVAQQRSRRTTFTGRQSASKAAKAAGRH